MMTRNARFQETSIDLHTAAAIGDVESLQDLLAEGHSVDSRDTEGFTPFLVACKQVEPDIAHVLLEAGADLEATNTRGMNGLFLVSANGVASLARDLIDLGADVNRPATRGLTPLIAAVMSENIHLVRLLIAAGADVDHIDDGGTSVRRWARKIGASTISDLLRRRDWDSEPWYPIGPQELAQAARTGDVEWIHECLATGLEVDARDDDGYTPLMLACRQHKRAAIELLLEAGADPLLASPNGMSPLLLAASNPVALRPFAELGFDLNSSGNSRGITPLMHASQHGHLDVVRFLLTTGVDPLVADRLGQTALDHADANGHRRIAHLLRDSIIG